MITKLRKKRGLAFIIVAVVAMLMSGCGNRAYEIVYHYDKTNPSGYNAKLVDEIVKKLDEKEGIFFEWALSYSGKGGGFEVDGKTVGEIIESYKKSGAKVDEVYKRATDVSYLVGATVRDKYVVGDAFDESVVFEVSFSNRSKKKIKAFEGTFYVKDVYGKKISNLGYSSPSNINFEPYGSAVGKPAWEINPFSDRDNKLKKTSLNDLQIEWVTERILFADGTVKEK